MTQIELSEPVRAWRPSRDTEAQRRRRVYEDQGARKARLAWVAEDVRRRAEECGEPIKEVDRDVRPATIASEVLDLLARRPRKWWTTREVAAALRRPFKPLWSTLARLKYAGRVEYLGTGRTRRCQPGLWRLKRT